MLLKGAKTKRLWAEKYNGLGGHVDRGEDVITSARRELAEEAGITADLWLCGVVVVDAGITGVCLFVIVGENPQGEIRGSMEGNPEWVRFDALRRLDTVEDLPILLERIRRFKRGDPPFSAKSRYKDGRLDLVFSE